MKNEILKLNTNRRGSFGEYIFKTAALTCSTDIKSVHRDSTDYKVDGIPIDVKTTYHHWIKNPKIYIKNKFHRGTKVDKGITRVNVIPYIDCVSVNYDNKLITLFTWDKVIELYSIWKSKKDYRIPIEKRKMNDLTGRPNKFKIAKWAYEYLLNANVLEQDENGNWYWTIDIKTERPKFLKEFCKLHKEKFGYHISPKMVLFNKKGRKWYDNVIKEKKDKITKPNMSNIGGAAFRYHAKVWTKEKCLNFVSNAIGRELEDADSIVNAVKLYYDYPKKYSRKEIIGKMK